MSVKVILHFDLYCSVTLLLTLFFLLLQNIELSKRVFKLSLARFKLNLQVVIGTSFAGYLIVAALNFFLLVHETVRKLSIGVFKLSYLRVC